MGASTSSLVSRRDKSTVFKPKREPLDFLGTDFWSWYSNWNVMSGFSVCVPLLSVQRWPLSVHLVKGLSAAGVEVRERGEQQSSGCIWRVFVSECMWTVGVRCSWWETRGGRDGVYAAATLIQDPHQKITFSPFLNQPKTQYHWTSLRKTLTSVPDPFVLTGWKPLVVVVCFCHVHNQCGCVNTL